MGDDQPNPDEGQSFDPMKPYEAEQQLLGFLMTRNDVIYKIMDKISAHNFADPLHGRIYDAILNLVQSGTVANFITLKSRFDRDPALERQGGAHYLIALMKAGSTFVPVEDYAKLIKDTSIKREAIAVIDDLRAALSNSDDEPATLVSNAIAELLTHEVAGGRGISKHEAIQMVVQHLDHGEEAISCGFQVIDDALLGGLYGGKLYGIGARMKQGKSAMLGSISNYLNFAGVRHGFWVLEQGAQQIEMRQVARLMNVAPVRLLMGRKATFPVDPGTLMDLLPSIPNNMTYCGRPDMPLNDLMQSIASEVHRNQIKGALVDYLQLIGGIKKGMNEEQHIRHCAQMLANLAMRLGIFIVIACQLNQEGNVRGGESIKLACDAYLSLTKEKGGDRGWMTLEECRYAPYTRIGNELTPSLILNSNGPYWSPL